MICLLITLLVATSFTDSLSAQANRWDEHIRRASELERQTLFAEAERAYLAAIEEAEKFGREDPRLLESLARLGGLYQVQKRYADAEALLKRQLAIREMRSVPESPHIWANRIDLAAAYALQGKYLQAAPLVARSLAFFEQANDWISLGSSSKLPYLVRIYRDQGRDIEAGELLQGVIKIQERYVVLIANEHGPKHPIAAGSLSALARLYVDLGRPAQAEEIYLRSIGIYQGALESFPEIAIYYASTLEALARLYRSQGRDPETEPWRARASELRRNAMEFKREDRD